MKFSVGITLYHPEIQAVKYAATLGKLFSGVYIYDNSGDNKAYADQIGSDCRYFWSGRNDGLSVAFNRFLKQAAEDGADYLLLLDQDSMYNMDVLGRLMQEIEHAPVDDEVAIRACKAQPVDHGPITLPQEHTNQEEKVISSGSFVSMAAVKKYDLSYDEDLFVDYVDDAFCKLVRSRGLQILCHNRHILPQQLGYQYKGRICHSAVRHYYMVRDLGYFNAKYYGRIETELKSLAFLMKDLVIALKEDKSRKKIVYAIRGYRDYLRKKHGQYRE